MRRQQAVVVASAFVALVPCAVMANGMVRMIQSFEFTLSGGLIGCVAGVIFALARHAKTGRLLALTIGGGVVAGLTAAAMFVGGNSSFFFPNNVGILLPLVVIALGTGVVGGLAAGLIGVGIRALRHGSVSEKSAPAGHDKRAPVAEQRSGK